MRRGQTAKKRLSDEKMRIEQIAIQIYTQKLAYIHIYQMHITNATHNRSFVRSFARSSLASCKRTERVQCSDVRHKQRRQAAAANTPIQQLKAKQRSVNAKRERKATTERKKERQRERESKQASECTERKKERNRNKEKEGKRERQRATQIYAKNLYH